MSGNTYPFADEMLITVFEAYIHKGKDAGYPESHWEVVVEEYDKLTGEDGAGETKSNIGRHTELILKLEAWQSVLYGVEVLFKQQPQAYAPGLCADLAKRFKPYTFSKETLLEDIEKAHSKLKSTRKQIEDIQELLPKGEENVDNTFFDNVLAAYEEVFKVAPNKETMTVQQFAIRYKKLKDRIEQDKKAAVDNG